MSTRNYWLYTHNENSWQEFHTKGGGQAAGFPNSRRKVVEKMQPGDYLLCYQKGSSRWIGVLEVISTPFYVDDEPLKDEDRIWHDVEFRNRVPVKVVVSLTPEKGIPMRQLLGQLTISRRPKATSWMGYFRDNPREWKEADGEVIVNALLERYIEVHHLRPVSSLGGTVRVDPKEDMTVLCSNYHRMIHRRHDDVLIIEQLQALLRR